MSTHDFALWMPELYPPVDWLLNSILYDDLFGTIAPADRAEAHDENRLLCDAEEAGLYRPVPLAYTSLDDVTVEAVLRLRDSSDEIDRASHQTDPAIRDWIEWRSLAKSATHARRRAREAASAHRVAEERLFPDMDEYDDQDEPGKESPIARGDLDALSALDQRAGDLSQEASRLEAQLEAAGQRCYDRCVQSGTFSSKDEHLNFMYASKVGNDELVEELVATVGLIPFIHGQELFLFGPRWLILETIWVLAERRAAVGDIPELWTPVRRSSDRLGEAVGAEQAFSVLVATLPRPPRGADPFHVLRFRLNEGRSLPELRRHLRELAVDVSEAKNPSRALGKQVDSLTRATASDMHREWPTLEEVGRRVLSVPKDAAGGVAAEALIARVTGWSFDFTALGVTTALATSLPWAEAGSTVRRRVFSRSQLEYVYAARSSGAL